MVVTIFNYVLKVIWPSLIFNDLYTEYVSRGLIRIVYTRISAVEVIIIFYTSVCINMFFETRPVSPRAVQFARVVFDDRRSSLRAPTVGSSPPRHDDARQSV